MEDWIIKNFSCTDPTGLDITVSLGNIVLEGIVFTCDLPNSCLILENYSKGFHIISIIGIKSISIKDLSRKSTTQVFNLPLDKLIKREGQTLALMRQENSRIGVGVSNLGQDIFDELSKTLPTNWSDKDIIVMDDILISDPYTPENCKIINDRQGLDNTLSRVQKVLSAIHQKLINV